MFYELARKTLELEKQGVKVIRLNIGETNLPTPKCAVDAAVKYIQNSKASYVLSAGISDLRERIAQRENCTVENVVVGQGSKHLLVDLISLLGDMGDTVVFPSPYWPAYNIICRQLGMKPFTPETNFEEGWNIDSIPFDNAKILILCNPLNPAGTVYSPELMEKTITRAKAAGVRVIIDEAYKGISFEDIPHYDAIRVRSFSKEFNMEGWRLGYIIAPADIARQVVEYNEATITCVPEFIQRAGLACLENEEEILREHLKIWKDRLNMAGKMLRESGFRFVEPSMGMYVFATHDKIRDSCKFAIDLLEHHNVAVAPGASFGGFNGYIRISLNQDEETLREGLEKIGEMVERQNKKSDA